MRREVLDYSLELNGADIVTVYNKDGSILCTTVLGVASALEAIFVIEGMNKSDWLLYEDGKVILTDRI